MDLVLISIDATILILELFEAYTALMRMLFDDWDDMGVKIGNEYLDTKYNCFYFFFYDSEYNHFRYEQNFILFTYSHRYSLTIYNHFMGIYAHIYIYICIHMTK